MSFLDLRLFRQDDNKLITEWYRKPISANRFKKYYSYHPIKIKINFIYYAHKPSKMKLTHITGKNRFIKICST